MIGRSPIPAREAAALLTSGKARVAGAAVKRPRPRAPRKAKAPKPRKASHLELTLESLLIAHRLPLGVAEHAFAAPERRWRFDRAWPDLMVAVEIQGGTFGRGAHSRGRRQREDFEKANGATLRGWRVLYADTDMVTSGAIVEPLRELLTVATATTNRSPLPVLTDLVGLSDAELAAYLARVRSQTAETWAEVLRLQRGC